MNAGKYDKYVEIQENNPTTESHNIKKPNWSTVTSVFCNIEFAKPKEIRTNVDLQIDNVVIEMWPTDINNTNRIKHDDDIYKIIGVIKHKNKYVISAKIVHE